MALTIRDRRSAPLWGLRLITLLLAWAWAIIAVGVGLNRLIKSNQQQTRLRNQVPAGTTLDINVKGSILAFFTVWLFAVQVAFTHFFRTRSAGVRAFINGRSCLADRAECREGLGTTSVYKRICTQSSMVTILFSLLAATMLFKAASRPQGIHAVSPTSATETRGNKFREGMVEKDRGVSTERERAVSTEKGADA
ncbi:hypothetical protein BDQ17DRAFT_1369917 [Cyathus striatus]|nr:hypothetical protein BDQ17DRAFT_1369917 [Cyathus striatus]